MDTVLAVCMLLLLISNIFLFHEIRKHLAILAELTSVSEGLLETVRLLNEIKRNRE